MPTEIITIDTEINKAITFVWEYYNKPKHIINWNFASNDWHCPKAETDFKVGGQLIFRMEAKDGSFGFDFKGTYSEIIPLKKVGYIVSDGRFVNIDFITSDNKTKIIIQFEAESMNPADMQKQGWQAILNNFKSYAEAN